MPLVVPNEGELELLRKMLKDTTDTETYSLRLYQNNYAPDSATTITDFTEANFTAYAPITLNRSDWSTPTTDMAGEAQTTIVSQSWTNSGTLNNTIFGYYVVGSTSGKVLWAEKLAAARILYENDVIHITPNFTLRSAN